MGSPHPCYPCNPWLSPWKIASWIQREFELKKNDKALKTRSDIPFLAGLWLISSVYILLIVGMLVADAQFTTPGELVRSKRIHRTYSGPPGALDPTDSIPPAMTRGTRRIARR